jgi:hypothetical protein
METFVEMEEERKKFIGAALNIKKEGKQRGKKSKI